MKHLTQTAALLAVIALPAVALDTIVITATRSEQASVITPTAITIITEDDIQKSGANNLADILRTQAGIQLQDAIGDGSRAVIGMRGFSATAGNNVLVMIDGRKLNNPSLEAPALSSISTKDIERIEIIQGSAGVLYGDQAVAGAINIITKTPAKQKINVSTARGTYDREIYRGSASQQFNNGVAYRVSAEKNLADNYRDNNEANYTNYSGRLDYANDNYGIFIEEQWINDNLRLPGFLLDAQVNQDRQQTTTPLDFSNRDVHLTRIGGSLSLTKNLELLADLTDRDNHATVFLGGPFESDTDLKSFNPRLAGTFPTSRGEANYTVGVDTEESLYKTSFGTHFEQEQQGAYGQINIPVLEQLVTTVGYRVTNVDDNNKAFGAKRSDTENAKELGFSYYGVDGFRLFTRVADTFRFANADENGFTLPGITYLDPQTSRSDELGLEFKNARLNILTQFFIMNLENEIMYDAVIPNPLSFTGFGANVNVEDSMRRGYLIQGDYALTDNASLDFNYTHTVSELQEGSFKGNEVPFVAEHKGSLGAFYMINTEWSAHIDATYTGSQYRSGDEANAQPRLSPYWLTNLNIQWQQDRLNLNLRINNLANKEYASLAGWSSTVGNYEYPAAERTLMLTASYDF